MKRLLITVLCGTALTLTACNKKPAEQTNQTSQTAPIVKLSTDNVADIKSDLAALKALSDTKEQEAKDSQARVAQARQTGDVAAAKAVIEDMQKSFAQYDKDLGALTLKSTEVDSLRKNTQKAIAASVEFMKESMSEKPDMQKVADLQKQVAETQQAVVTEHSLIKQKIAKG